MADRDRVMALVREHSTWSACTRIRDAARAQVVRRRVIYLPAQVHGDGPFAATAVEAGYHVASANPHGALFVPLQGGGELGVKPGEFEEVAPERAKAALALAEAVDRRGVTEAAVSAHLKQCQECDSATPACPQGEVVFMDSDDAWDAYLTALAAFRAADAQAKAAEGEGVQP